MTVKVMHWLLVLLFIPTTTILSLPSLIYYPPVHFWLLARTILILLLLDTKSTCLHEPDPRDFVTKDPFGSSNRECPMMTPTLQASWFCSQPQSKTVHRLCWDSRIIHCNCRGGSQSPKGMTKVAKAPRPNPSAGTRFWRQWPRCCTRWPTDWRSFFIQLRADSDHTNKG